MLYREYIIQGVLGKGGNYMIDYSYTELDDDVSRIFNHTDAENYKTAVLENTLLYAECEDEPDMFLFHLALIVYEVKHNILTDRMKADFIQYAKRWDKGEFQPELLPSDIPIIQKDIDYVRSVLKL